MTVIFNRKQIFRILSAWGALVIFSILAASQTGLTGSEGVPAGWKKTCVGTLGPGMAVGQAFPKGTAALFPPVLESAGLGRESAVFQILKGDSPPGSMDEIISRQIGERQTSLDEWSRARLKYIDEDFRSLVNQDGAYVLLYGARTGEAPRLNVWRPVLNRSPNPKASLFIFFGEDGAKSEPCPGSVILPSSLDQFSMSILGLMLDSRRTMLIFALLGLALFFVALWASSNRALKKRPLAGGLVTFILIAAALSAYCWNSRTAPSNYAYDSVATVLTAACLCESGEDEHGQAHPVSAFRSIGGAKPPVYTYLLALAGKAFKADLWFSRKLAMALGVLATALTVLLSRRLVSRENFRVGAGPLFAFALLSSWVMTPHRLGHEISLTMFSAALLMASGMSFLEKPHSLSRGAIFGAVTGLMPYMCHATKFLFLASIPLALAALFFARGFKGLAWGRSRGAYIAAAAAFLMGIPILLDVLGPGLTVERMGQVGAAGPLEAVSNYFRHFNLKFLFFAGDANPRHHTGYRGMLNIVFLPFFAAGLARLAMDLRRERSVRSFYVLAFMLAAFIPASLSSEGVPHATRTLVALPAILAISFAGFSWLFDLFRRIQWERMAAALFLIAFLGGVFEAGAGLWHYHNITIKAEDHFLFYSHPLPAWEGGEPLCDFVDRSDGTLNYRYYRIVEKGDFRYCRIK